MNPLEVQAELVAAKKLKGPLGLKLTQLLKQKLQLLQAIHKLDQQLTKLKAKLEHK